MVDTLTFARLPHELQSQRVLRGKRVLEETLAFTKERCRIQERVAQQSVNSAKGNAVACEVEGGTLLVALDAALRQWPAASGRQHKAHAAQLENQVCRPLERALRSHTERCDMARDLWQKATREVKNAEARFIKANKYFINLKKELAVATQALEVHNQAGRKQLLLGLSLPSSHLEKAHKLTQREVDITKELMRITQERDQTRVMLKDAIGLRDDAGAEISKLHERAERDRGVAVTQALHKAVLFQTELLTSQLRTCEELKAVIGRVNSESDITQFIRGHSHLEAALLYRPALELMDHYYNVVSTGSDEEEGNDMQSGETHTPTTSPIPTNHYQSSSETSNIPIVAHTNDDRSTRHSANVMTMCSSDMQSADTHAQTTSHIPHQSSSDTNDISTVAHTDRIQSANVMTTCTSDMQSTDTHTQTTSHIAQHTLNGSTDGSAQKLDDGPDKDSAEVTADGCHRDEHNNKEGSEHVCEEVTSLDAPGLKKNGDIHDAASESMRDSNTNNGINSVRDLVDVPICSGAKIHQLIARAIPNSSTQDFEAASGNPADQILYILKTNEDAHGSLIRALIHRRAVATQVYSSEFSTLARCLCIVLDGCLPMHYEPHSKNEKQQEVPELPQWSVRRARRILTLSCTFYRMTGETKEYLKNNLLAHPIWKHPQFWQQSVIVGLASQLGTSADQGRTGAVDWTELGSDALRENVRHVHMLVYSELECCKLQREELKLPQSDTHELLSTMATISGLGEKERTALLNGISPAPALNSESASAEDIEIL